MSKVFLALGNKELEDKFKELDIEIVDEESDLNVLKDLLKYIDTEYLIINRLLDNEKAESLIDISRIAQRKNIKVIIITSEVLEEKKLVSALVAQDVNAFVSLNNIGKDEIVNEIESYVKNYPESFDYNLISTPEVKIVKETEVIKEQVIKSTIVKQEVIACYSDNSLSSAQFSIMMAETIANETDLKTLVIDFDTITPSLDLLSAVTKEIKIESKYDSGKQTSLEAIISALDRGALDYEIFKELIIRDKNYHIMTGLFDLIKEEGIPSDYYEKIIDMAKEIYDVVIINVNPYIKNTATFISLKKASRVVTSVDANFISIRNLKHIFSSLRSFIDISKVSLVINNISSYSLSKEILNQLLKDYKVLGYLTWDENINKVINEQKGYLKASSNDNKNEIRKVLEGLGYILKSQKQRLTLFRRKG
ncbi:hypothetical protein [Clostridium hydrogeniformans]|uniref:hypothetical protein n=1 Tax=Clostridium hydrogeniformans TaxID=349933 RepID=UPI000480C302|nr:hypothetical protein [Clostridium hydrogeniformans]